MVTIPSLFKAVSSQAECALTTFTSIVAFEQLMTLLHDRRKGTGWMLKRRITGLLPTSPSAWSGAPQ